MWFLIVYVLGVAIAIQGPRRSVTHWPSTWREVLSGSVLCAAVVAIVAYALQLVLRKKIDPLGIDADVVFCDTCHRVKRRDSQARCECGGRFDDLDNWNWIDDEKDKSEDR